MLFIVTCNYRRFVSVCRDVRKLSRTDVFKFGLDKEM